MIDDVRLSWSNTGFAFESDGQSATARITEGWQITHSADATILEIVTATGLPKIGSSYLDAGELYCKRINSPNRISPIYTIVTVEYEAEVSVDSNGQPNPNNSPINDPPVVEWSDESSNEPIDKDWNNVPIVNVNHEPIQGVTVDIADPVLVVTKNFATYNPHLIHAYRMATNSDVFASFPAGTARLIGSSAKLVVSGSQRYWQVTGRFKFRYPYGQNATSEKAWYFRTKNEGFKIRLDPGDDAEDAVHAKDAEDNKVVTPVLIKEDGTLETDPAAAHFLEFQRYGSLPFNALGFGV